MKGKVTIKVIPGSMTKPKNSIGKAFVKKAAKKAKTKKVGY